MTGLQQSGSNVLLLTNPALPSGTSDLELTFKDKTYRLGTDLTWSSANNRWEGGDKSLSISDGDTVDVRFTPLPESAPSNVVVTPGDGEVKIRWVSEADADSHKVRYRLATETNWTDLTNQTSPVTITGLTSGAEHQIQVGAVYGATTTWTSTVKVVASDGTPSDVDVEALNRQLNVTWTDGVGANSHVVRYRETSLQGTWLYDQNATSPHAIPFLNNGTEYELQVGAVLATGDPKWTATVRATPNDPAILSGTMEVGEEGSSLGYSDPSVSDFGKLNPNAFIHHDVTYTVTGLQLSTFGVLLHTDPVLPDGTSDLDLAWKNKTYRLGTDLSFTGLAWEGNAKGLSIANGDMVDVRFTPVSGGKPAGVTALRGNASMEVSWTNAFGADSHSVRYGESASGPWTVMANQTSPIEITGLDNGKEYHVQVGAVNGTTTQWSSAVTITPLASVRLNGTMDVGGSGSYLGFSSTAIPTFGSMTDTTFTFGSVDYTVTGLQLLSGNVLLYTSPTLPSTTTELEITWDDKTYLLGTDLNVAGAGWEGDDKDLAIKKNSRGVVVKLEVKGGVKGLGTPDGVQVKPGDSVVGLSWRMSEDENDDEDGADGQSTGPAVGFGPRSSGAARSSSAFGSVSGSVRSFSASSHSPASAQNQVAAPGTPESYEVGYTVEGAEWSDGGSQTVTDTTASISGLENGETYAFRVRAQADGETGPWSETVTATPGAPADRPTDVTIDTGADMAWKTMDLSFAAPPDGSDHVAANSQYRALGMKKGASWTKWTTVEGVTVSNGRISGTSRKGKLAIGRVYEVEVRWCGATPSDDTCSAASDSVFGATPASAPTKASAESTDPASPTALKLSWAIKNVGGNKNLQAAYELGYAPDPEVKEPATLVEAAHTPAFGTTDAKIAGLAAGTAYRLFVRSVIQHEGDRHFASAWVSATATTEGSSTLTLGAAPDDPEWLVGDAVDALTLPDATGGTGAITYSLDPAAWNGLSFDATTRALSGTPEEAGSNEFTYTATDEAQATATLTFTVTVTAAPSRPQNVETHTTPETAWKTLDLTFDAPPASSAWVAAKSQIRVLGMKTGATRTAWRAFETVTVEDGRAHASTGSLAIGRVYEVEVRWCGAPPDGRHVQCTLRHGLRRQPRLIADRRRGAPDRSCLTHRTAPAMEYQPHRGEEEPASSLRDRLQHEYGCRGT